MRHYLEEMEAPQRVTDILLSTSSADMQWVDTVRDGLKKPPSVAEWIAASCGQLSHEEDGARAHLNANKARLSANDALLLKMLEEKSSRRSDCEMRLISRSRDQLPRP
jgi:hypothetical protein